MPYTIGGHCEVVSRMEIFSAYEILTMYPDSFLSDSYIESYGQFDAAVHIWGNRTHVSNSYIFGALKATRNIKDLMVTNCDIWQNWDTPGVVYTEAVTTSQYRFTFVGCRFLAYSSNTHPLVKLDDFRSSAFRFIGCVFDEDPLSTGLVLDDAHDLLVEGCEFGSTIQENVNWHLGQGIDVRNSKGVVVSDSGFYMETADVGAVKIGDAVEELVIQGSVSRGNPTSPPILVDVTDGPSGPIDIIDNAIHDAAVAIRTTRSSGSDVVDGLTIRGNRVRDVNGIATNGSGIEVAFAPDSVIGENRIDDGYLKVEDSDRPQIVGNVINAPAGAVAAIDLGGTIDEAWIHGCAFPIGGAAYGVQIGASVTNTEVRTLSNNWRGAATADLNDSGTGTLT